jgi:ABC-2 type transport system permease protein
VDGASLAEYGWWSSARVVLAIARKDCLHFVRYPLNAFFRMFEPLIWLTPVYFLGQSFAIPRGNSGFAAYAGTGDYMSFILLGTVLSNYVAAVFWGMGVSLKSIHRRWTGDGPCLCRAC